MKSFVGNDLVDLAAAHNRGRAHEARFLERILTGEERARMARDDGGDHGFALLWSAKEAAFKAAVKRDPALVFAPRRWQVEVDSLDPCPVERKGTVVVADDARVPVRWRTGDGWLHCVAVLGDAISPVDEAAATVVELDPYGDFSARERQGFSCRESGPARTLARRLLERHGFGGIEILRIPGARGRLPPAAYAGGAPLPDVDLSLSHDGRFVAAVVTVDSVIGRAAASLRRDRPLAPRTQQPERRKRVLLHLDEAGMHQLRDGIAPSPGIHAVLDPR